ncbi:hypothetical protein K6Y76_04975 [Burkholderia cenocepacia]|nr:hypothetical protein [Burkholderia cenocepacia]MCW3521251.1 hypothetical protein [Burkholderia cenocepacia]MCW3612356.1 hypothetical protein [Burkholderia cenocepacia]MCW3650194.1 hypothetical protein [Burkholderia cenocepacia]MCW3657850.1 hypothetical protein [Burkholderia cenocepacia]MCW3664269.1 hypothetical protein [Burkholderia cenocepacia]
MNYELLAQCIRSGQLTAAQIQEHMRDEDFAVWYRNRYSEAAIAHDFQR